VGWQAPIALARKVVTLLEEHTDPLSHRRAIFNLIANGPCYGDGDEVKRLSDAEVATIAHALQGYLRGAVRHTIPRASIDLSGVRVHTLRILDGASSFMDGPVLGQAVLALTLTLHLAGFKNLWRCKAPDCPHIFVKTHKQEYCSGKCQRRHYKQTEREADRAEREALRVKRARRAGRK